MGLLDFLRGQFRDGRPANPLPEQPRQDAVAPNVTAADVEFIAAMGQRIINVVNESLQIAGKSKNIKTRRSRVRVAHEKIEQLGQLAAEFPFLKIQRLDDVERDLAKIDCETDSLEAHEASGKLGLDGLLDRLTVEPTANFANELIDSITLAILIARDSKSVENRRSNVALARHQLSRWFELAEKHSFLKAQRMAEVEGDLVKIGLETDRLAAEYSAPESGMFGRSEAFLKMPLSRQCETLGLPLDAVGMERAERQWFVFGTAYRRPEDAALAHFQEQGWNGTACEGWAVLMLMKAACLDYLAKVNTFGNREDACMRFFEAQCRIHRKQSTPIIGEIERAGKATVQANLAEIMSQPRYSTIYPAIDAEALIAIWQAITPTQLASLASRIFDDPGYRAGWPDLTLARGNEVMFVEVKTTDKLHASQRDVILGILKPMGANVRVLRLKQS